MTTIVRNRRQLWTSTLSPHLLSPHLDFPDLETRVCDSMVFIPGTIPRSCLRLLLTNFRAPFFKELPSFFCGVTPSKTLAAPQPLNSGFPLGNGGVLRSEEGELFWERKKPIKKKKHVNKIFTGLSRDFWGEFVYVFCSPIGNGPKKTHKQNFGTHPVPGQSREFVYVYVFFLSREVVYVCWAFGPRRKIGHFQAFSGLKNQEA